MENDMRVMIFSCFPFSHRFVARPLFKYQPVLASYVMVYNVFLCPFPVDLTLLEVSLSTCPSKLLPAWTR